MFSLIVILPLFNFIFIALFGRFIGYKGVMRLSLLNILISFAVSCYFFYILYTQNSIFSINLGTWVCLEDLVINFSFTLDKLSLTMFILVLAISYLVHLYSCSYMRMDPHFSRFMSYLSLFTFFMLILVAADNFPVMFIGWEGVGLCSYLLIGFWHTRIEANKASIKALVVNRVGDVCILLAMAIIFHLTRSLDFQVIYSFFPFVSMASLYNFFGFKASTVVCVLLFIGIVGKSAQIGLHLWLPDAMEGPTPVSALIHAATMVTAGIYLCIRMSYIFEFSSAVQNLMILAGCLTAFISGLIGFVQTDIKKIIAFSTCTQLGYMLLMCGMSQYEMAFYHLLNHAFFKALLFLAGGVVIHLFKNQDVRKMGGIRLISGFLYVILLIGTLASDGFFFSSVESKDLILEVAGYSLIADLNFSMWFGILSLCLTICYNSNLLDICGGSSYFKSRVIKIDLRFLIVLGILAFFTLMSNYILFQTFLTDFFGDSVFINYINWIKINPELLPFYLKILIISLFGILSGSITKKKIVYTEKTFLLAGCFLAAVGCIIGLIHVYTCVYNLPSKQAVISIMNLFFDFFPFILVLGAIKYKLAGQSKSLWVADNSVAYFSGIVLIGCILCILHVFTAGMNTLVSQLLLSAFETYLSNSPLILLLGFILVLTVEMRNLIDFYNIQDVIHFFYNKLYYDWLVNNYISKNIIKIGMFFFKFIDKGIFEILGPDGVSSKILFLLKNFKSHGSGYIYNYVCIFLIFMLIIFLIIKYFF